MNEEDITAVEASFQAAQKQIKSTLEIIAPLVQRRDRTGDTFSAILSTVLRRNYYTGASIYTLSSDWHNGPAMQDLSRQMIEDLVNIEWMLVHDQGKQAEKFQTFIKVDAMNTLAGTDAADLDISHIVTEGDRVRIVEEDKAARQELGIPDGKPRISYNMRTVDQMLDDIEAKELNLAPDIIKRIRWLYGLGNSINHTNAGELLWYQQEEDQLVAYLKGCRERGTRTADLILAHLTSRYLTVQILWNGPKDTLALDVKSKLEDELHASYYKPDEE